MALKSNKVEMLIKLLGGVKNSSEDPVKFWDDLNGSRIQYFFIGIKKTIDMWKNNS